MRSNVKTIKIGRLVVISGPMFCGKTEAIQKRMREAGIAKLNWVLFKASIDNRYSIQEVVTHNLIALNSTPIDITHPEDILLHLDPKPDIVGIDEGQFFSMNLVEVCLQLTRQGITVIVAGLNQDFRGECFGPMGELEWRADDVQRLHSVCNKCGSDNASRTQRIVNGHPARRSDPIVLVGAHESYEARCPDCHEVPD